MAVPEYVQRRRAERKAEAEEERKRQSDIKKTRYAEKTAMAEVKRENEVSPVITATAGKQTPIKTTITNKPSGVSVKAAPVSVGTEKSGRQAQLEDSRRRTQEIQWDREAEAKRKEKTNLTDRSNAVEYLQKASGIAPKEESNVKAYENNYSDAAVKNAQERSAELKEMAAKLQEEIKYSENRHSAYFSNKLYDRAEKEKNHKRDLESQLANINGQLKYYDKVMGNATHQRVGNALKGIGATGAASLGVLGETVKTAAKDSIENLRNNELQNEMWEEQQRLNSLGMSAPERAAEMRKFREENADKFVKTAVDPNSRAMQNYRNAMTYTEKATEGLEGGAKVLADTGISVAESVMRMPLAVVNPALPLVLAGIKGAAGKAYELNERGIASGESLWRGIASGVIEAATEKIPLDNLVDMVKKGGKGFIREMLEQAGIEGTEEGISYIGNYIVDKAAKDPEATFSLQELATSILQGGLSGMFFGVGGGVTNALTGNTQKRVNPTAEHYKGTQAVMGQNGVYQDYAGVRNENIPTEQQSENGRQYALRDVKVPETYEELIKKPDIKVVDIRSSYGKSKKDIKDGLAASGVYNTPIVNRDTGERIFFNAKGVGHSINNDGNENIYAAEHIPEIIENAVLAFKQDEDAEHPNLPTDKVYVFWSAVRGKDGILPVKLMVKEYDTNNFSNLPVNVKTFFESNGSEETFATLYDNKISGKVLNVEDIEIAGVISHTSQTVPQSGHRSGYKYYPATVSIAELLRNVNEDARKYLPKSSNAYITDNGKTEDASKTQQRNKALKMVNAESEQGQQKYREIMANYGFGETMKKMDDAARRMGRKIVYYMADTNAEGYYEDGVIYFNIKNLRNTKEGMWSLFKHELTHVLQGTDAYSKLTSSEAGQRLFNEFLIKYGYAKTDESGNTVADVEMLAEEIRANYSRNGEELTPMRLNNEIIARFVEQSDLFTNEESIRRLVEGSPTVAHRIYYWIKDMVRKFRGTEYEKDLINAERMYLKAIEQAGRGQGNKGTERENLFVRERDRGNIRLAEFYENGGTPEEIWQTVQMKRDRRGDWITEIDDSKAVFDPKGKTSGKLGEVFKHDVLYTLYPKSRDIGFAFADLNNANARYIPAKNMIILDNKYKNIALKGEAEEKIIHELQHYLQYNENRNVGGSNYLAYIYLMNRAYEKNKNNRNFQRLKNYRQRIEFLEDDIIAEHGGGDLGDIVFEAYRAIEGEEEARKAEERKKNKSYERRNMYPEYGGRGIQWTWFENDEEMKLRDKYSNILAPDIANRKMRDKMKKRGVSIYDYEGIQKRYKLFEQFRDDKKRISSVWDMAEDRNENNGKNYEKMSRTDRKTIQNEEVSEGYAQNYRDKGSDFGRSKMNNEEKKQAGDSLFFNGENEGKEFSFRRDSIENTKAPSLNAKADRKLKYAANSLMEKFKGDMGISRFRNSREMGSIVRNFAKGCAEKGYVDSAEAERVFEELFDRGMVENREFYEQYKDVAAKIRGTQLYDGTLGSEAPELRRKYYGNIHLVTNPRALKIDSFYQELCGMYPELFSEDIAEASDQLIRMKEVLDSIRVSEESVRYAYDNMEEAKALARGSFDSSLRQFEEELNDVMIYASQKEEEKKDRQERKELAEFVKDDVATAKSMYEKRRSAKEEYNKLAEKELIGEREKAVMDQLWKKEITMEQIPKGVNKNGIEKVYKAYRTWKDQDAVIKMYKKSVKEEYAEEARSAIANSDRWKDKSAGWKYSTEIMERNFEDITKELGKETGNKRRSLDAKDINETYFKAIHHNEAESTRMKNDYTERIKKLELGTKEKYRVSIRDDVTGFPKAVDVSESSLVQLFGEKMITEAELKAVGADVAKIKHAVSEFRSIYNELIDKTNVVLVRNGYEPVPKRKDYFPHFTEAKPDTMLGKMASFAGINIVRDELPTDIAGLTHTFRPGKRWVGNFLQRVGKSTDYDALKGFDRYIDSVSDVIWHTDDIQRLRALENELRYKYSDSGTKERLDTIRNDDSLTPEEKQSKTEDILKNQQLSHLPNLVTALRNYTDSLAGKKSIGDRTWEQFLGRGMYNTIKSVENKISANMVALNPGSWLTNFIPITQAMGEVRTDAMLNALWDTVKRQSKTDGFTERSDFIVNRKGADAVSRSKAEKAQEFLTKPFKAIDEFTSEVVTRALYYDHMRTSKDDIESLEYANDRAARIMADRSKGAMPTVFNNKNPVSKLFTMFQVEVNNQYRYMFKDVPGDLKEKGLGMIAMAMFKMWLGAWLYNYLYEEATGRKAAFDPIDLMMTAGKDIMSEDKTLSAALIDTGKNVLEEVPFVGGILGGGRIPISSALPDVENVVTAGAGLISGDMDSRKALTTLAKEAAKPGLYILPPVGGGQAKKTLESIGVLAKGGEYTYENDGDPKLRYAVEDPSVLDIGKALIFGKSSLPEYKDYMERGFKALSAEQTKKYHLAVEAGISYPKYMEALSVTKGVKSDKRPDGSSISPGDKYEKAGKGKSASLKMKEAIDGIEGLSKEQREVLHDAMGVSEKVW